MITIRTDPDISIYQNFLSEQECYDIIWSSLTFTRSKGLDPITAQSNVVTERTSSTAQIETTIGNNLQQKIYDSIRYKFDNNYLNLSHFENLQVQLYEKNQEYLPHYDFFDMKDPDFIKNNRIATIIIYLNEDFVGGETWFPKLDLKIKPEIGKMLYFDYKYSRNLNELTIHAGCPVDEGEKYIITSWIRQSPLKDR